MQSITKSPVKHSENNTYEVYVIQADARIGKDIELMLMNTCILSVNVLSLSTQICNRSMIEYICTFYYIISVTTSVYM